ncbi:MULTISPECIES: LysR family transcriptional regulator [Burkholderia]|jgi:DNA-binding transcriptional LysR family regulator|uniref:Transcriptional regulator, LysR family n=4 Tax=Burkholderia cepacia complex TaxID=87882 RepID=B9BQM7_9BURK|nr:MULTISPECIES: LysR family transcriptional regulator [Burkholderia]KIS47319.1 bacterial regulatory helix-turn-helix, lysR family protein [Burkholderia cepacia]EEE06922.1 transcriptional regulator, LysR family [Burkholderia multivorans CGD2]EEE13134.1 transcriptional regulator, LysR family [Burkholderia multivorans CGD2M]ERI26693.1 LysR substrate-binding domain protein [Burkholderia cenocepacia BC7]MBU9348201.1 LysR family transcriptional regulator [Burkholderia multivorans]
MDQFTCINVFVAAVDEGSLAAAARRFGFSAAMAGKYVSELESTLNARLLQRTTRRLNLTDVGRAYYDRCVQILDALAEANREASDSQTIARGVLRIAAPVTFGALHLGNVVARYMERHPHVNVDVSLSDRYVNLLETGADLAIRIGTLADSSMVARKIAPCRMIVCASPAYLKRHGTPHTPEELGQAQRLTFSEAVSSGDWTLRDEKDRPHVIDGTCRMSANNMQMLLASTLAGAGIAYGPTFVFGKYVARGELVALLPTYRTTELTIQAVYPSTRHVPLKVREFIDDLVESFGDEPSWDNWRQV